MVHGPITVDIQHLASGQSIAIDVVAEPTVPGAVRQPLAGVHGPGP